jgi:6-phosphogluconolactonase
MLKDQVTPFDARRNLFIGSTTQSAIDFALDHWIHSAKQAIQQRGKFVVALSGGSTPKAIYQALGSTSFSDWEKVFLFWSDERSVPPDHPDSNYKMAMESFSKLPIPPHQIFRMQAEKEIEKHAVDYEDKIKALLPNKRFDLVMLGVGEDGHTASLFPKSAALDVENRLVVPNYVEALNTWRMTFTYPCINSSLKIVFYALGKSKKSIVQKVLEAPIQSSYPASRVGTPEHPALWILDA